MILSDNLRGALFMICGMAGFTFNDACMKLVTEVRICSMGFSIFL